METKSFWLISIEETNIIVSLISVNNNSSVDSIGLTKKWIPFDEESFLLAVDESLSSAALNADISEDQEPESAAFVLPPFWVDSDGKIVSGKLKLIENVCRSLKLKPTGFISYDEAIVEEANSKDGFPASFILFYLGDNEFTLSLVYLGNIKERIHKNFSGDFNVSLIELALLEFNSESTLPPQIIAFGNINSEIISNIKNYPWIGRKDIETFLHFPEIKIYSTPDIIHLYAKTITSQLSPTSDSKINHPDISQSSLEEVTAESLGFDIEPEIPEIIEPEIIEPEIIEKPKEKKSFKINFPVVPKIHISFGFLKKIKFRGGVIFLPLIILLSLTSILFYFSKANITLFVTPFSFLKTIPIKLDSTTTTIDSSKSIIPVEKKTFNVTATTDIKTTGQKVIGDKAKGEIVVFNKLEKTQTINKGAVLQDSTGKKFELINSVQVASSSSNLSQGVITLGQTKALVAALDIGPEYNLDKDIKLLFKDFSENSLVANVKEPFTGGSKRQINAVSKEDKVAIEQKITEMINTSANEKINKDFSDIPGIIRESIQSKTNRIEYNREVGEEADDLTASVEANITVFVLDPKQKNEIVNSFLIKENNFEQSQIDSKKFNLSYKINKIDKDFATGELTIDGQTLPKIDLTQLTKNLVGKTKKKASEIIKKSVPKLYNYQIKTNFLLPFQQKNIIFEIKTEPL